MNLVFIDGKLLDIESSVQHDPDGKPYGTVELGRTVQPARIDLIIITAAWEAKFFWSYESPLRPQPTTDKWMVRFRLEYKEGRHPNVSSIDQQESPTETIEAPSLKHPNGKTSPSR